MSDYLGVPRGSGNLRTPLTRSDRRLGQGSVSVTDARERGQMVSRADSRAVLRLKQSFQSLQMFSVV